MPSRHERRKAKKQTERLLDEAWEALQEGERALAAKLSRRAMAGGAMNPRVCDEHGQIMRELGETGEAEEAFRTAMRIAPAFAPAFVHLAELQASLGKWAAAVRLQERAVELLPLDDAAAATLAAYRAAYRPSAAGSDPAQCNSAQEGGEHWPAPAPGHAGGDAPPAIAIASLDAIDQDALAAALLAKGLARLPRLFDAHACAQLRALAADPRATSRDLGRDDDGGRYELRLLREPMPPLVAAIRTALYPWLAAVARGWSALLRRPDATPADLAAALARRAPVGLAPEGSALLRLPPGGFRLPERPAWRDVFPLQLWVDLGSGEGEGEDANDHEDANDDQPALELSLTDVRPGRRQKGTVVRTAAGDGVIACVRDRLVVVGGVYGLQAVATSLRQVGAHARVVLAVRFLADPLA